MNAHYWAQINYLMDDYSLNQARAVALMADFGNDYGATDRYLKSLRPDI